VSAADDIETTQGLYIPEGSLGMVAEDRGSILGAGQIRCGAGYPGVGRCDTTGGRSGKDKDVRRVSGGPAEVRCPPAPLVVSRRKAATEETTVSTSITIEGNLPDEDWNFQERAETPVQRLDRNWTDLLQELRVLQTGVQLLTGFLLILPFQARFSQLSAFQNGVYLAALSLSVAATGCLIAPVSMHRTLFRWHARSVLVSTSHRLVIAGILLLGATVSGTMLLIFGVVAGTPSGLIAAGTAVLGFAWLWAFMPRRLRIGFLKPDGMFDGR